MHSALIRHDRIGDFAAGSTPNVCISGTPDLAQYLRLTWHARIQTKTPKQSDDAAT
jgi:hypothetical protein